MGTDGMSRNESVLSSPLLCACVAVLISDSIGLWIFEQYYIFAGTIAFIATVSIIQTLIETRRRMRELAELARFDCEVNVLRDGAFQTISSTQLVPGDIVQVATGLLPCDLALLDGGAVVNESSLTGESVPVVKTSIQFPVLRESETILPGVASDARTTLFSATKIMQLKPSAPHAKVLAMVVRTGFATTKGSLILSILYPKPSEFKFETQSYKFIAALFTLAMIGFGISIWQLDRLDAEIQTMIIRGLDLITIVVPPSLPLALTVGINFALVWLRQESIFCISPSRISMAGKIRCMCFDKTGQKKREISNDGSVDVRHLKESSFFADKSMHIFLVVRYPHRRVVRVHGCLSSCSYVGLIR